ncbi:MAG: hypothetical protein EOO73_03065 [Myxococcales bacterium]|nr:MAG: hypothetical protein EOO73_03065 [Myxococcales bacterium]
MAAKKTTSRASAKPRKAPGTKRRRGVAIRPTELGALELADVSGATGKKAHSLRERAQEVVRMYRELAGISPQKEADYELEFEEPARVTCHRWTSSCKR